MAPHVNLWLVARGINIGLQTRLYFADEAALNADRPGAGAWSTRRAAAKTLLAKRREGAAAKYTYVFDIQPARGCRRDGVLRRMREKLGHEADRHCRRDHRLGTAQEGQSLPCPPRRRSRWRATHAAFEAGASLVHIHVRNPDESPSSDPALFGQVQEGVRKHCPGMIVQFSTGGRGRDPAARGNALELRPDMASPVHGVGQLPDHRLRERRRAGDRPRDPDAGQWVRPEIEIFDLSHIHGARRLIDAGLMDERPHVQVVMGVKNALPAEEHLLDLMLGEIRRQMPWGDLDGGRDRGEPGPCAWTGCWRAVAMVCARGWRTISVSASDRLAASNAELVRSGGRTRHCPPMAAAPLHAGRGAGRVGTTPRDHRYEGGSLGILATPRPVVQSTNDL